MTCAPLLSGVTKLFELREGTEYEFFGNFAREWIKVRKKIAAKFQDGGPRGLFDRGGIIPIFR